MNVQSLGDLAQTFAARRQNVQIKQQATRLTEELASGKTADVTQHLAGNFGHLSDIEHDLLVLDSYRVSAQTARFFSAAMQTSLENIQTLTGDLGSTALVAGTSTGVTPLISVSAEGKASLDGIIASLNTELAGRSLFSGTDIEAIPLVSADNLLSEVRTALIGTNTAADVITALDTFFDTPGGAFETLIYQGGTASLSPYQLGNGESVTLDVRADDTAFRTILKYTALAAVVNESTLTVSGSDRQELVRHTGEQLLASQDQLIEMRANLGFAEARIDQSEIRISTELSSLEYARGSLLSVDKFKTATELENIQIQLETLYTLTARASRLSLVNFLS